jgi:VWFA-related protein
MTKRANQAARQGDRATARPPRGWRVLAGGLACLMLALWFAHSTWAQSGRKPGQAQPGQQPGEKPILRLETKEVIVPLSAYDAEGNLVGDLAPTDVLVLEDGEARPVSYIRHEPANIVLIIDSSNEIGTFKNGATQRKPKEPTELWKNQRYELMPRPTAREFAEDFVSKLAPADQIAIIQYADRVQLMQDWTHDKQEALTALKSKYRVGLKASYYDALKLAAEKLEKCPTGRRVIALISDGLDSNSKASRRQALTALEKVRAAVFVVGWSEVVRNEIEFAVGWIGAHERSTSATAERMLELRRHLPKLDGSAILLRELAEASGGEIWLPETHNALVASTKKVVSEIGAQYSLAFITETKPSLENTRAIQVFPARRGLTVRSRRSYYVSD